MNWYCVVATTVVVGMGVMIHAVNNGPLTQLCTYLGTLVQSCL